VGKKGKSRSKTGKTFLTDLVRRKEDQKKEEQDRKTLMGLLGKKLKKKKKVAGRLVRTALVREKKKGGILDIC